MKYALVSVLFCLAIAVIVSRSSMAPAGKSGPLADTSPASSFGPFDTAILSFMKARGIAGGALAVIKDCHLVYARGYGLADREGRKPVCADSLFRIASLSKPITAVAVMKLVEQGRLRLDDRAFDILKLSPSSGQGDNLDARLHNITVQHLLNHMAGWDREKSFDPMFRVREIAHAVGKPSPAGPQDIVRYMFGRPLDFEPGSRYAYSNFGYCVLGRVIEKVAGTTYENHVQQHVLAPIGIRTMRIGKSLKNQRAEREVRYYVATRAKVRSVFDDMPERVPPQYGGFCVESMDAHGGWIASVTDVARFVAALDDPEHSPLVTPQTFRIMYAPPPAPAWRKPDGSLADRYYACGGMVRPVGRNGKATYWHAGSLPGSYSLMVRRWDGISWVVLFNQRSGDPKLHDFQIDSALHRAADSVSFWPSHDLFPEFGYGE